jgi:hypothetical protein
MIEMDRLGMSMDTIFAVLIVAMSLVLKRQGTGNFSKKYIHIPHYAIGPLQKLSENIHTGLSHRGNLRLTPIQCPN